MLLQRFLIKLGPNPDAPQGRQMEVSLPKNFLNRHGTQGAKRHIAEQYNLRQEQILAVEPFYR